MAKTCWFCDRKLNMLNIIPFDGKSICSDCSDLYDKMMFSQNKAEVEHSVEILLSMCEKGTEAYEYIIKYSQKCPSASSYEEESREEEARKQREEQEAREKECEKARIEALEQQAQKDLFLKSNSHEGYYEYKAGNVADADLNAYATMPVNQGFRG